jgi:hypothetical protein
LNCTPAPKKSPPCLLIHTMSLSLSPPRLLTYSDPLLSLSICTAPGPLLSLSISIGDCSGDHLVSRLRSDRVPPKRPLRRPPHTVCRCGSTPTTTPRPGNRNDDKEALRWAALERLPTHPARCRGSSRPLAPGAHRATYFSSTSPWATSPSRSSPPCPPLAHGHGDAVSIERRRDSSSLHAIVAREVVQLGRPRARPSRRRRSGGVTARSTSTSASRWWRSVARSTSGLDCGLGLNCFLLGITDSSEQGPDLGPMGLDLGLGVFCF